MQSSIICFSLFLFALISECLSNSHEELAENNKLLFKTKVLPFLNSYCIKCHGEKKMKSGVRLDLIDSGTDNKNLLLLQHSFDQISDRAMPPEDEDQPSDEAVKSVAHIINDILTLGKSKQRPKNGSARRITVQQYQNLLEDLLGTKDQLTSILPNDGMSVDGFTNNKESLHLTPQLIENYFDIANKALDLYFIDDKKLPEIQSFRIDLGKEINKTPTTDKIQLNGPSLLSVKDYFIYETIPRKDFSFNSLKLTKTYDFQEGYNGNATVREWKNFQGLHHSIFVGMIGRFTGGYNYGRSSIILTEGIAIRPRSPESKGGKKEPRGPSPTLSILTRELPKKGLLKISVDAARYNDAFQPKNILNNKESKTFKIENNSEIELNINNNGVFQIDVIFDGPPSDDVIIANVGKRTFSRRIKPPYIKNNDSKVLIPLMVVELNEEDKIITIINGNGGNFNSLVLTPVSSNKKTANEFQSFKRRNPYISAHLGVRTDVGARLSQFDKPKEVNSTEFKRYSFFAPVSSFPLPYTENTNVNYLAGLHELAFRSEPTDDRQIPRIVIKSLEIEGPFLENWPPKEYSKIFFSSHHKKNASYARKIINRFAEYAFRRPLTNNEEELLFNVWNDEFKLTNDFRSSIKSAFLVILTSPQFLFITEESKSPAAEPLSAFELANKLSFFLWNSGPDEKLISYDDSSKLVLSIQDEVNRMIHDPRFGRFMNEFVYQWLDLEKFELVNTDHSKYPKLNSETKRELMKEPIHFITHLIRSNLNLSNLIDSDFIVANDVVAGYYGLGNLSENGYEFKSIKHKSNYLGGILTQPAILSGLSDGSKSNPIKRGAWFAKKIIADPPKPPPPNVPEISDNNKSLSMREQLELHRNQNGCMECHKKIDPWGLPFEEYDAGGLHKNQKVDSSSELIDGIKVKDFRSFKKHLIDNYIDDIAHSFLKHLSTYAVGRDLEYIEIEYLKSEGTKQLSPQGYPLKDCINFIINSPIFMEK